MAMDKGGHDKDNDIPLMVRLERYQHKTIINRKIY